MRQTVVGVFDRHAAARQAAQQLRDSGFADSVFVTDDVEAGSSTSVGSTTRRDDDSGVMSHVRNFFSDLFGNDDDDREVRPYAEAVRRGGAVVKVEVEEDAEADAARTALVAAGAVDIEERASEWRADGWDEGTSLQGDAMTTRASLVDDDRALDATASTGRIEGSAETEVIPVVKEELQVGKRVVSTGGVRVYARTVETPVEESVSLRSQHAEVARRAVDRPATEADIARGERTIEVREMSEEAVVSKEARVVEEVVVGKTEETRTEQIRDTLRSTEVEVETLGGVTRSAGADWDASAYRTDFDRNYAVEGDRWEDYEPAYRYGHTMRDHPLYAGRDWDEVEPDLRSDWETRNSGGTWDRFKAAVRRGWDRMTG